MMSSTRSTSAAVVANQAPAARVVSRAFGGGTADSGFVGAGADASGLAGGVNCGPSGGEGVVSDVMAAASDVWRGCELQRYCAGAAIATAPAPARPPRC